jgi:TorA maturation chaperone TorD
MEEFVESWHYLGLGATENIVRLATRLGEHPDRDAALHELEREYTRLFVNAYPGVVAPPYSSVYLDKDRLVWGPSTSEVVKLYMAAGLGIAQDFHDIPDHIAAELEFASYLISMQPKRETDRTSATEALARIEIRFLVKHLFKWAPAFFRHVSESSAKTFYGAMAEMGGQFITWDGQQLEQGGLATQQNKPR